MNNNKTIELVNLSIGYNGRGGSKVVAECLNASVFSSELTCLLGANGVGKSTLLKTITAAQKKLAGDILFNGKRIEEYSHKSLSSLISIVLTEKVDIKNMTVFELIGLGRSPYTGFWGTLNKEDRSIIENALGLVNIEHLSKRLINTLSDGERQKVMIAKAMAQQTPVILLDEPTAFLDFPSKVEMMQLLHGLSRKTEKTIFLSTHDLDLALQIADRIWLMDDEKGIKTGIPEDLSLDGSLSDFFERKGIIFCKESGLFKVEGTATREIKVKGSGNIFAMVKKALLRNGITVTGALTSNNMEIIIDETSIIVRTINGESKRVSNIEELLNIILK